MENTTIKNDTFTISGSANRPILLDVTYVPGAKRPVIIYAHGFNGFKDWGNFDLIAGTFAQAGFAFVKFNFSHNGTSPDHPQDFVDLEAFGRNNYTKQLNDLGSVLDWISSGKNPLADATDADRVGLIGHSMGGGIAIVKTAEDRQIKALVTWAAISQCKTPWGSWPADRIDNWKATGVDYYINGRTKQRMPLYYQLYEDYQSNAERLDIPEAARRIAVPWQLCHGTEDTTVLFDSARALHAANPGAQLVSVAGDHVFGRRHPWTEDTLPGPMLEVLDKNIAFFGKSLR